MNRNSQHRHQYLLVGCVLAAVIAQAGCATNTQTRANSETVAAAAGVVATNARPRSEIRQAAHQESLGKSKTSEPKVDAVPPSSNPVSVQVEEFVQLALAQNPRLAKANFAIEAAMGKHLQAGLYPNPVVEVRADELGDRTGPPGIITAPGVSQEIVTGNKLSLSQAVAAREVDLATLSLFRERYDIIAAVRTAYYDLYSLERRIAVLDELAKLSGDAVKNGKLLLEGKQIARLDLVQLEIEASRFQSQAESVRQELAGTRKRLAAIVGDPKLLIATPVGPFEELPSYELERSLESVLASHPDLRIARMSVDRAHAAIHRAEVEVIPNVTLSTGYIRQSQNRSNDWMLGLSVPVPVWNKNQGNIRSAKAEYSQAVQEVARVQNDLTERVATASRTYSAAKKLVEQYQREILPKAEETYKLSMDAFKGGQFEYLRVIQSQRAIAEAKLESVRALGDAWKAAAELSGLLLEESWPGSLNPVTTTGTDSAAKSK